MDEVRLVVSGKDYLGWKSINITRSLEALSASFNLTYADAWDYAGLTGPFKKPKTVHRKWYIQAGDACEVYIGKDRVITGFVDEVSTQVNGTDRSFSVSGRDVTGDLIDCAASTQSDKEWKNITVLQIANVLVKPFSIKVKNNTGVGTPLVKLGVSHGESAYDVLERAARQRGILLVTSADGELVLEKPGSSKSKVSLVEGNNILSCSLRQDFKRRFSNYYLYGSAPGDARIFKDAVNKIKSSAVDAGISRYRPRVIISDDSSSAGESRKRIEWEAAFNAAKGTQVTARVNGWRQGLRPSDPLWKVNQLCDVKSSSCGIDLELLVEAVTFSIGPEGQLTELVLTRKDAWVPNPVVPKEFNYSETLPTGFRS